LLSDRGSGGDGRGSGGGDGGGSGDGDRGGYSSPCGWWWCLVVVMVFGGSGVGGSGVGGVGGGGVGVGGDVVVFGGGGGDMFHFEILNPYNHQNRIIISRYTVYQTKQHTILLTHTCTETQQITIDHHQYNDKNNITKHQPYSHN